jgi:YD repeat-containing protein
MIMKIRPVILSLLVITFSCSKKNDPAPATSGCLLSSSTTTFSDGGSWLEKLNYNSSNVISSMQFQVTSGGSTTSANYNYTYDGSGRLTKLTLTGTAQASDYSSIDITYSGSSTYPSTIKVTLGDGSYSQTTYTYNSSNQATQSVNTYFDQSSNTTSNSYRTYNYPNTTTLNVSSIENYVGLPGDGGASISTEEYTYDDKNNPMVGYDVIGATLATTNNVLTHKSTTHTNNGDFSSTVTYTYSYDTKGYPVKKTYLFTNIDPNSTVTITYAYTNCN